MYNEWTHAQKTVGKWVKSQVPKLSYGFPKQTQIQYNKFGS